MRKLTILLRVVAIIQITLGVLYLLAPNFLLGSIGHSIPPTDLYYPLGMLASRFLVVGLGFWLIAQTPKPHRLWIDLMIFIQLIDLGVGVFYTATGVVSLSLSGFPMFNAIWISVLLYLWRPDSEERLLAV